MGGNCLRSCLVTSTSCYHRLDGETQGGLVSNVTLDYAYARECLLNDSWHFISEI